MKTITHLLVLFFGVSLLASISVAEIKKGDTLQTLTNLHPDLTRRTWYTINYQLASILPACETVTVKKISRKKMVFDWNGVEFVASWEKHTKGAGVSFQEALANYFGPSCDKAKIEKLSKKDKEGFKSGRPAVGMTKDGVLLAMGRPPMHATPSLDLSSWTYWRNRFATTVIEFDDKGVVTKVR